MLFFYFFTARKMSPNLHEESGHHYEYTRMRNSISESLSLQLKQVSLQMEDDDERHRIYAIITCFVTVLFNLFLGAAAFVCAAMTDSSAGYAFALDCLLDAFASSLLIWRFYGATSFNSEAREEKACIWLGSLLCISSIGIIVKSAHDLVVHSDTVPQLLMYVFILAGVGGVMNSLLGGVKYWLGKGMKSQSLVLEAVNTLMSALLAMMLGVSDVLFYYHQAAWRLDPVTSIFVALILFLGGIRVLCHRKRSEETTPLISSGAV